MFRRRVVFVPRPFLRRPRLWLGAVVAGAGYAAGRARARAESPAPGASEANVARLKELADLHAAGHLTDEEFSAAKRKLLGMEG